MNYLNNDIQIIKRLLDAQSKKEVKRITEMFTAEYLVKILSKLEPDYRQQLMNILYD